MNERFLVDYTYLLRNSGIARKAAIWAKVVRPQKKLMIKVQS